MRRTKELFSAVLFAAAVAAAPVSAKTLKAAYFVSPKHPIGVGYQFLADEVKKASKGDIKIRIFAGESLLGAKAISDGVKDGVADMGHVVETYTPAYYPHGVMINDLAMVGPNDMAAAMAVTELNLLHCSGCVEEFAKQNAYYMGGTSTPPYVIIAKGDFNSVEKIHTKKLRAAGSLWDRFCRAIGAVAVNMPTAGMYEAISRGTLDGALYAIGGLKTHGLGDVATQVIMLNTGSFRAAALVSMNKNSWAGLSDKERDVFMHAMPKTVIRTTAAFAEGDKEGVKVAKEKHIPMVKPDPELQRLRDEFVEKDQALTIKNGTEKLGLKDSAEFVANYKKLYAKYDKLIASMGNDEKKLSDLLYKEVYAKLDPKTFSKK